MFSIDRYRTDWMTTRRWVGGYSVGMANPSNVSVATIGLVARKAASSKVRTASGWARAVGECPTRVSGSANTMAVRSRREVLDGVALVDF